MGSVFDAAGNKATLNNGKRSFLAKTTIDVGRHSRKSKGKKGGGILKGKGRRSKTMGNQNSPYGGYGSHNYRDYLDDGYKKNNAMREQQRAMEQKEREQKKEKEEDSDESEDSEDDGQSESNESEEEGVRLNSVNDFKEQLAFLQREYTKLQRMVSALHSKSDANDAKIRALRNEVRILKGEDGDV